METGKVEQTGVNKGGPGSGSDTQLTRDRSGPVRYRFTDAAGKIYAPFRLKPSVTVSQIIQQAFPGSAHDTDWSLEKA